MLNRPVTETCPKCGGRGKIPVGRSMRDARQKLGLRALVVAQQMGISQQYLNDLEGERRGWTGSLWQRWRDAINALLSARRQ